MDGTPQHGGVGEVEPESGLFQESAGFAGLSLAFVSQIDIGPAGKTIFAVPNGLAVAHEDNFVHGAGAAGAVLGARAGW